MKLPIFQIPAVAHLPPAERDLVVKRCLQSPAFQRYREFAPQVIGGIAAVAFVVALCSFLFSWWNALISMAAVILLMVLLLLLKIAGELWLLRYLAKKAVARTQ